MLWIEKHREIHNRGKLMRALLEIGFVVNYIVYSGWFARRDACLLNHPCHTLCLGWACSAPPALIAVDTVLLWTLNLHLWKLVQATQRRKVRLLLLRDVTMLVETALLPGGLLLARSVLVPLIQPGAADLPPPGDISLQLGFLRLLLLFKSTALAHVIELFTRSPTQVQVITAALRLVSLVLFFAAMMNYLIGGRSICFYGDFDAESAAPTDCPDVSRYYDRANREEAAALLTTGLDSGQIACTRSPMANGLPDFLYYSLITFSTVGYGDFAPPDALTRFVSIVMMAVLMTYIPLEVGALIEMAQRNADFCMGQLPQPWHDYVLLLGPISPGQLASFAHEFCLARGTKAERHTRIIVLTPLELRVYREAIGNSLASRVYVQRSDVLDEGGTRALPLRLSLAKAVFIFSDTESSDRLQEDTDSLVRCLVMRKQLLTSQLHRISVQLNRGRERKLALSLGVSAAIPLDELKMGLLAVTCTRCHGLTTLLTNLLLTSHYHPAAATQMPRWKVEYRFRRSLPAPPSPSQSPRPSTRGPDVRPSPSPSRWRGG